jgi:formamidopyrimidine-DNA glycosylase
MRPQIEDRGLREVEAGTAIATPNTRPPSATNATVLGTSMRLRELRAAVRSAIRNGGVHTGTFVAVRGRDGACPRCAGSLSRGIVGGRTTYWCGDCQVAGARSARTSVA